MLDAVVVGEVLGGELADGVGPARLAHRAEAGDVALRDPIGVGAEDLAGREVDEALDLRLGHRRLQKVVGADEADLHGGDRHPAHRVDPGDRGQVHDHVASPHRLAHLRRVEHVPLDEAKPGMLHEPALPQRLAVAVVEDDDPVRLQQAAAERLADETRPAGDEHLPVGEHRGQF